MLKVVCAIIEHNGKVLVTQRSSTMAQPLLWEFPGGKLEAGESETEALVREIQEELHLHVAPLSRLTPTVHHYTDKSIELIPYVCKLQSRDIVLAEHNAYSWAELGELQNYSWCPADIPIVAAYLHQKHEQL